MLSNVITLSEAAAAVGAAGAAAGAAGFCFFVLAADSDFVRLRLGVETAATAEASIVTESWRRRARFPHAASDAAAAAASGSNAPDRFQRVWCSRRP